MRQNMRIQSLKGTLNSANVSFGYAVETDGYTVDDFLPREAWRNSAFVGATGAGKTTIMQLLARFYEVE